MIGCNPPEGALEHAEEKQKVETGRQPTQKRAGGEGVVVSLAAFMEVLDTSIANVALPHIDDSCLAGSTTRILKVVFNGRV